MSNDRLVLHLLICQKKSYAFCYALLNDIRLPAFGKLILRVEQYTLNCFMYEFLCTVLCYEVKKTAVCTWDYQKFR